MRFSNICKTSTNCSFDLREGLMEKWWIVAVSQLKVLWMIQWVTEPTELAGVGSECGWREGEWEGGQAGKDGWWMVLIQEEAASLYLGSTNQTCRGDGWAVSPLFMDHLPSPICPKNQNHSKIASIFFNCCLCISDSGHFISLMHFVFLTFR